MPGPGGAREMTRSEAIDWLKQVEGTVYRNPREDGVQHAWVAMVRTPPTQGRSGKIILAFGNSLEGAAVAAEAQWQQIWSHISQTH